MKAFALLDLLMAMMEDHTIGVVSNSPSTTQAGLSYYSIRLLEIIYQYNTDFFKGTK